MSSYTKTRSAAFTIVHARHIISKVAADMHLCQAYYGSPNALHLSNLSEELALLLKDGYVQQFEFGFKENDVRVVSWRYTVSCDGTLTSDDRPGRVYSSANIDNATFYNHLIKTQEWWDLDPGSRDNIEEALPIKRTAGSLPSDGAGYWTADKSYSSKGTGTTRNSYRPY